MPDTRTISKAGSQRITPGYRITRQYRPVELVWSQEFPTRIEALAMERRIKGWSRPKKLALIRGDWAAMSALAATKNGPSTSSGRTGKDYLG
ncbi:GIY-YIG nuclease family protein [Sphingomonas sp. RS2018]